MSEQTTGSALRAAREAAGFGLREFARQTHWSAAYLSQVERGQRPVGNEIRQAYADALGTDPDVLMPPPGDPLRIAHEWLLSDPPPHEHMAAGRRVGSSLAAEMERRVVELRRLDDAVGGSTLHSVVRCDLDAARAVVRDGSHSSPVRRRLLRVVGELAQLGGWVYADAGRYHQAQRIYLDGMAAATEAGDRPLAGQLLSTLSYQTANIADPRNAALLARTALRGASADAPPVVCALLGERVAWAAAKAGDVEAARRALDAVDDEYDRRRPGDDEPDWTYWLNRDEIDVMRARSAVELGDAATAEALLSPVLARFPAERKREAALYRSWLAEAYARGGQQIAARETLERVRVDAADLGSARLEYRVHEVEKILTGILDRATIGSAPYGTTNESPPVFPPR
ncbi:helix-turn-helix domain-containing protein [Nocardia sp. NBC_01329]|uniref:helix-turn-helix domain-containing protein n=1 Tax=Nocardia sp. NBC_01329 TaxID=2903594 RepID=UPI002E0D516C|nr:helix-turn-helix domain-containing protein [Nocardia sp. NBC_01329]